MNPYFSIFGKLKNMEQLTIKSTFYYGDCLVEMDKIADKSVDAVICDLPYGVTACKWDVIIPFIASKYS